MHSFFQFIPNQNQIIIYTDRLKVIFSKQLIKITYNKLFNEVIINLYTQTLDQWDIIDDKLNQLLKQNKGVFTYTINTSNNTIEFVFDADKGMIEEF